MTGSVVQLSISHGGVPKRAVSEAMLTRDGFTGDHWAHPLVHGGPKRAVLLVALETIQMLCESGFPLYPGALGENITTRGLDPRFWRTGQCFRLGQALIEFTKIRTPCRTLDVYGSALGAALYDGRVKAGDINSPKWALSGFYASVLQPGLVRAGDPVDLYSEIA